jgi:hypothetical protein
MRWQQWLILMAIPALMVVGLVVLSQQARQESEQQLGPSAPAAKPSEPVWARQLEVRGISDPEFLDPDAVDLPPSEPIIGLVVDGEPRAYVRKSLSGIAKRHVISDQAEEGRITVTHCDLSSCTRVFVEPTGEKLKDIRVGGLKENSTLELLIDGQRYPQRDQKIPLAEFPFVETTWERWLADHPQTKVYTGGLGDG